MDNQCSETQSVNARFSVADQSGTRLSLIALGLDFLPFLLIFVIEYLFSPWHFMQSVLLVLMILSPVAGVITGIYVLYRGRGQGKFAGKYLAIAAVVLPLIFLALALGALYMLSQAMMGGM